MKKALILSAIFAVAASAQTQPAKHKVTDLHRFQLIASFQKSTNLQMQVQQKAMDLCKAEPNCGALWQKYNTAVAETNVLADTVAKEESLPAGTQFSIDIEKNTVDATLPAEAPKAAEKK